MSGADAAVGEESRHRVADAVLAAGTVGRAGVEQAAHDRARKPAAAEDAHGHGLEAGATDDGADLGGRTGGETGQRLLVGAAAPRQPAEWHADPRRPAALLARARLAQWVERLVRTTRSRKAPVLNARVPVATSAASPSDTVRQVRPAVIAAGGGTQLPSWSEFAAWTSGWQVSPSAHDQNAAGRADCEQDDPPFATVGMAGSSVGSNARPMLYNFLPRPVASR
jgi:hypothetical protein